MSDQSVARKLTAILYADVAGYSRLTGADEVATHRQLSASLDLISERIEGAGGRIVHYAGDAVLADFVSVVAAVDCAVGIQRELSRNDAGTPDGKRVQYRIGVNLGEVIVDRDDIYGDGVNVAARLQGLAEPGGICVSGAVYSQVKGKLDVGFQDLGPQQVKNIEEPVRGYRILLDPGQAGIVIGVPPKADGYRRWAVVGAVLLVLAVAGIAWQRWAPLEPADSIATPALPLPNKPSVAILPFDNLSDDPAQDYFADGLTEDLISNLSLYRELFVIARNSSFVYKGKAVDVKQVGRELGVAFVVEGSIRRENNRVRINAQLIDARTGSHIWAERFDRELIDVFAVQDEITRTIAGRLGPEMAIARVEETRAKPTVDLGAWDLYLQARAAVTGYTPLAMEKAVRLGDMAIARDPHFAAAHGVIARAKGVQFFYRWTDNLKQTLAEAIESARTAIRLDGHDPIGFAALGYVYRYTGDDTRSIANLERAVALNPNDATIRLEYAHTLDWFRYQKRALPEIIESIRLSPRDPRLQLMLFYKAHILFHLHDYEASLDAAKEMGATLTSDVWRTKYHLVRAASLAELGRADKARVEIENAMALDLKLSLASIRQMFKGAKNHPGNRKAWLDSLRKAGMPEE